jgi:hypothetical protein
MLIYCHMTSRETPVTTAQKGKAERRRIPTGVALAATIGVAALAGGSQAEVVATPPAAVVPHPSPEHASSVDEAARRNMGLLVTKANDLFTLQPGQSDRRPGMYDRWAEKVIKGEAYSVKITTRHAKPIADPADVAEVSITVARGNNPDDFPGFPVYAFASSTEVPHAADLPGGAAINVSGVDRHHRYWAMETGDINTTALQADVYDQAQKVLEELAAGKLLTSIDKPIG